MTTKLHYRRFTSGTDWLSSH